MRCFSEKGLHETSLADIGKASGMRPGHIHYYFPSKVSIIEAVNEISAGQLAQRIERMFDAAPDAAGAILGLHAEAEDLARDWQINPLLRIELTAETFRNPALRDATRRCSGQTEQAVVEAVRRAVAEGKLGPDIDPAAFARAAVLIWNAMSVIRVWDGADLEGFERTAEALIGNWAKTPR
jgi:AcrR family transcriptional regulator